MVSVSSADEMVFRRCRNRRALDLVESSHGTELAVVLVEILAERTERVDLSPLPAPVPV
jgi:hypothetical protein